MNVYEIKSMAERLSGNTYPGRGIVLGVTPDGKTAVSPPISSWAAASIPGTGSSSRSRTASAREAFDPCQDGGPPSDHLPSRAGSWATVSSSPTATRRTPSAEYLAKGESPSKPPCAPVSFEPDGPNWTPRISGLVRRETAAISCPSCKAADAGWHGMLPRFFYEYARHRLGWATFIHTYVCDGNPHSLLSRASRNGSASPRDIDEFDRGAVGEPEPGQQSFPVRALSSIWKPANMISRESSTSTQSNNAMEGDEHEQNLN